MILTHRVISSILKKSAQSSQVQHTLSTLLKFTKFDLKYFLARLNFSKHNFENSSCFQTHWSSEEEGVTAPGQAGLPPGRDLGGQGRRQARPHGLCQGRPLRPSSPTSTRRLPVRRARRTSATPSGSFSGSGDKPGAQQMRETYCESGSFSGSGDKPGAQQMRETYCE